MAAKNRQLSKEEIDKFLKNNSRGILAFDGSTPYCLPMGYLYKRKTILIGMYPTGRKSKYLDKSMKVCFTVYKARAETTNLKTPCTSLVVEGTFEEVTNKSYYSIKRDIPEGLVLYRIKVKKMGARECARKCSLVAKMKKGSK